MSPHVSVSRAGGGIIDVTWLIGVALPAGVTVDVVESGDAFTICVQLGRQSSAVRADAVTGERVSPANPIDPKLDTLAQDLVNRRLASRDLVPVGPQDVGPAVRRRRALRVFAEVTGGTWGYSALGRAREQVQLEIATADADEEEGEAT